MNSNAKYTILFLATIFVMAFAQSAHAQVLTGPSVEITIAKYEPSPAEPGNYVDVWLNAQNNGGADSGDVSVTFLQNFPFYLDSGTNATVNLGKIPPSGIVVRKFRFLVDAKAPTGTANLNIQYGTGDIKIEKSLAIDVRARETQLFIPYARTEPGEISAGGHGRILIGLDNAAGTPVQDIVVRLDFSKAILSPVDSVSERRISRLLPGVNTSVSYEVVADPSAESAVYQMPLTITYTDSSGTAYNKSGIVGVIINSPPSLELNIETKDPVQSGVAGNIVFSVSNTGQSNVKFLTMSILPADTYAVVGRSKEYLGKLDPDDFETAEFSIFVPKNVKQADFKIRLDYRDAFNNEKFETRTLSVPVYSASDLSGYGIGQKSGYGTTIVVIAIIALAYYLLYRRRKKRRAA